MFTSPLHRAHHRPRLEAPTSNFWLAGTYYRLLDTVQAFNHHTEYA